MSPAHKLSSLNSSRAPSPETTFQCPKMKDKKLIPTEDSFETSNIELKITTRNKELGTIQENKSVSEAEQSSEIVYDDESSGTRKMELFGESCKAVKNGSPVLTFLDSGRLLYTKCRNDVEDNVFGNVAFETHPTDKTGIENFNIDDEYSSNRKIKIRPSPSLDFGRYSSEVKKRKLSVETKLETIIQPKGFLKETFGKLFEYDTAGQDSYKSYLCDSKIQMEEDNL